MTACERTYLAKTRGTSCRRRPMFVVMGMFVMGILKLTVKKQNTGFIIANFNFFFGCCEKTL